MGNERFMFWESPTCMQGQKTLSLSYKYTFIFTLFALRPVLGKLLFKVMRYNIALLPKKVTNYVT